MSALLLNASQARAGGKVAVDEGGTVVDAEDTRGGMPSSNPRVRPLLAAHPGEYVVICVAGCNGKPRVVQLLPRPATARVGGYVPSMAKTGNEVYGPPPPAKVGGKKGSAHSNDVVCVAGCLGRPGEVLQRISDLPPPQKAKPPKANGIEKKLDQPLDDIP